MLTQPFTAFDEACMRDALALGESNMALARPNPSVGCVITRGDQVIARAATQAYGSDHAEQAALKLAALGDAKDANDAKGTKGTKGATVYVTLEPCAAVGESGRKASCCDSLIAAQVARVVISVIDTNPKVNGRGVERLRAAGIAVDVGLLADDARMLHAGFLTRMSRGMPWVRAKIAASLDGRTALANGVSQWITGEAARTDGHRFRARACAVLTGAGTLRLDNPTLTVRHVDVARQPLRVLLDPHGEAHAATNLFKTASVDAPVLIVNAHAGAKKNPEESAEIAPQVSTISLPDANGRIDLRALLRYLAAEKKINELHLEAGARLTGAFLDGGLVDELLLYLAPSLIGPQGKEMVTLPLLAQLPPVQRWKFFDVVPMGDDVRLRLRRADMNAIPAAQI